MHVSTWNGNNHSHRLAPIPPPARKTKNSARLELFVLFMCKLTLCVFFLRALLIGGVFLRSFLFQVNFSPKIYLVQVMEKFSREKVSSTFTLFFFEHNIPKPIYSLCRVCCTHAEGSTVMMVVNLHAPSCSTHQSHYISTTHKDNTGCSLHVSHIIS